MPDQLCVRIVPTACGCSTWPGEIARGHGGKPALYRRCVIHVVPLRHGVDAPTGCWHCPLSANVWWGIFLGPAGTIPCLPTLRVRGGRGLDYSFTCA